MSQLTIAAEPITYFESRAHPWAQAVRALMVFGIVLGIVSLATDYHTRFYNTSIFFAFGARESRLMFSICVGVNAVLNFVLLACSLAALRYRIWALHGLIRWAWVRILIGVAGIVVAVVTSYQAGGRGLTTLDHFSDVMLRLLPEFGAEMRALILPVVMLIVLRAQPARELFETRQMN
jgi:hypothetical protein